MRKTNLTHIRLFILIAIISGTLTGCGNTEGTLKIKGKVIDEATKTGISRKNIIVHGLLVNDNKFEPIETGQFSTDSSGCFTYLLRKVKDAHYYKFSMVGDSDYVFVTTILARLELEKNAEYLSFPLRKLVDLTIKLNRKSKTPSCDTLRLCWESNGVYGGFLYPHKIISYEKTNNTFGLPSDMDLIWIGGIVNSTVNTKVFADKMTILSWELYRNGRKKEFEDTIICKRDIKNIVYFTY
jgi:hypothetical protein